MRHSAVILMASFCSSLIFAEEPILDRLYQDASVACQAGDSRTAVNHWYKYLEIAKRLENGENTPQFKEVQVNYLRESGELKSEEHFSFDEEPIETVTPPSDNPEPVFSEKKKRRHPVRKSRKPHARNINLPKLLARAEKEKTSGHFENAERLYRLALQIEPESGEAKSKLAELNQVIGGGN